MLSSNGCSNTFKQKWNFSYGRDVDTDNILTKYKQWSLPWQADSRKRGEKPPAQSERKEFNYRLLNIHRWIVP